MLCSKGYVAKYREHNTSTYLVLLYTTFVPDVDIVVCSTVMGNKVYNRNVLFFFCSMTLCKRLTLYKATREYDVNYKYGRHREWGGEDIAMYVISQNFDGGNDDSMQNLSHFKYRKLD